MSDKILFILKYRQGSDGRPVQSYGGYFSSGLYWSARFVVNMLNDSGVETKLVQVTDNNDIDREVFNYRPSTVIIEALWIVPKKFDVLKKLHPNVRWFVRLHSNIPFLANEGMAISWIKSYASRGVQIGVNSEKAYDDVWSLLGPEASDDAVVYLPNYYPVQPISKVRYPSTHVVRIGCYGAIRPLKNQLLQAIAAIRYADEQEQILHFHINGTRVEMGGEPILKNLQALFKGTRHSWVEDTWMSRYEFLERLRHLDLGLQVSLSETFCITAADMVNVGLPLVASSEVPWAIHSCKADPTDGKAITRRIKKALTFNRIGVILNRRELKSYSERSKYEWLCNF